MSQHEPGWHDDPTGRHEQRFWTGVRWSRHVADGGDRSVDPLANVPGAAFPDEQQQAGLGREDSRIQLGTPNSPRRSRPDRRPRHASGGRGRAAGLSVAIGLVLVAAVVVFVLTRGTGDEDPAGGDQADPVLTAVADYIHTAGEQTVDEAQAGCMAQALMDSVGRERLEELGVGGSGGIDTLSSLLSPEETRASFPMAFECIDDATLVVFVAATFPPESGIQPEVAGCMTEGWMVGLGREGMTALYLAIATGGLSTDLTQALNPEQQNTLTSVAAQCSPAPSTSASSQP